MIYRALHKNDAEAISPLILGFCKETGATEAERDGLIDRIRTGTIRGVIAENGSICGIAGYSPQGGIAVGEFVYVVPEKRGILGGALFNRACKQAKEEQNCKMVILASTKNSGRYKRRGYSTKYEVLEKEL